MSALLSYENGTPQNSGRCTPMRWLVCAASPPSPPRLLHRERTGRGQHIDLSMQEANFTFIGDAWLEYAVTGHVRGPLGNRHPLFAPHGIYPCAGVDQWIAIGAETDAQFTAIAATLGLDTAGFTDNAARKSAEEHLDELIAAKTATRNKHDLADALTAGGVPAAPVLDAAEVSRRPELARPWPPGPRGSSGDRADVAVWRARAIQPHAGGRSAPRAACKASTRPRYSVSF